MSNLNFNDKERLFERLDNLNISNAQEDQQDQAMRNMNVDQRTPNPDLISQLNEMNETLTQIKSHLDPHNRDRDRDIGIRSRCTCENFIDRCNQYIPNNFMVFFSFIVILIGIFFCICGYGKYGSCTMNNCLKTC